MVVRICHLKQELIIHACYWPIMVHIHYFKLLELSIIVLLECNL